MIYLALNRIRRKFCVKRVDIKSSLDCPIVEFGPNDHREGAPHFTTSYNTILYKFISRFQTFNTFKMTYILLLTLVTKTWKWWHKAAVTTAQVFFCLIFSTVKGSSAILCLKLISEKVGSDMERLWIWMTSSSIDFESRNSISESFYIGSVSFRYWFQK